MPPPFRFQSLLEYRKRLVEDQQVALAQAQRVVQAAQTELARLRAERDYFAQQLTETLSHGSLRVDEVEHQYRYLAALDQRLQAQAQAVAEAESAQEQVRAGLEQALKERKTLEKLQEHDLAEFRESQRKQERDVLDDINISRHARSE
jgi:flagellar export protein FliJ